ncbi:hypothetical protein CMI47_15760 [Candidatus Pacearchaeota archaeon]|nr:hypothetical protein [Candidatus Pacearchaeota archaeon]|tara:strand:+ start:2354 stop:2992 length:639 start_codon:yes stop_codon:yes gene_type:complete
MSELDIKHISVIDALPVYGNVKTILEVGAGRCKIASYLADMGYDVTVLDIEPRDNWKDLKEHKNLTLVVGDIFDYTSAALPYEEYDVVICSEVLEHLPEYKKAFKNLKTLATHRLVITVPHAFSFAEPGIPPIGHCNFWYSNNSWKDFPAQTETEFRGKDMVIIAEPKLISEFISMSHPCSISISKIRTKPEDTKNGQCCYLMVIDKRQHYG